MPISLRNLGPKFFQKGLLLMTVDENDTYYIFLFELNVRKINAAIAK